MCKTHSHHFNHRTRAKITSDRTNPQQVPPDMTPDKDPTPLWNSRIKTFNLNPSIRPIRNSLCLGNLPWVMTFMTSLAHEERASKPTPHWPDPCMDVLGRLPGSGHQPFPPVPEQVCINGWDRQDLLAWEKKDTGEAQQSIPGNDRPVGTQLYKRVFWPPPKFFKALC